jgi:deazaflavin-dependent oxidoreductase (nitroreductase family)
MAQLPEDMGAHNRALIATFRAEGGADGRPLVLLTTTGRRSGELRTTPMMYVPDGERLLVVASNAGAAADPDWYRNLLAEPRVHVELGPDEYDATAAPLEGEERDRVFARICEQYPFFVDHQAQVERTIPVVALSRLRKT